MEYELIISRASPYSSKIVALMGYSEIPHRIRIQNGVSRFTVIQRLTGKSMVPVLRRGDWAINDSTRIARYVMERTGQPTLPQPEAAVLAWFLEDFADEWMARWMVDSRWRHREDAENVSEIIGRELTGPLRLGSRLVGRQAGRLIRRQVKGWGARRENGEALQGSAVRCLEALESILSSGPPYLFGGYPTVADFAFYGVLGQYHRDPTGRDHLQGYPAIRAYVHRLEGMAERPMTAEIRQCAPRDLRELQTLFAEMMGTYWSVLVTNHRVREAGEVAKEASAMLLDGSNFLFQPSGYLQRRLRDLLMLVDDAYGSRDRLFGEKGIRMERGLIARIADLSESEAGRRLLRDYRHVGLH